MRGNTRNLQNNGNQDPGTPPGQNNMFDAVDPFDQLCGRYFGSSTATILGRTLFGGCVKASSKDECDQGGFFVKNFVTGEVNCDERCEPNTCRGAEDIIVTAESNGVSWSSASSTTTMGMVVISVNGGKSKDGSDCQGGGAGLPIPYDCEATVKGGATRFSCFSQAITPGPVGGGTIPAGVLRADATLSPSGVLNWQASALNPDEFAPSAGEVQQQVGEYLKSGNIMGKKTDDIDCFAHSAGTVDGLMTMKVSDKMKAEICSGR